MPAFDPPTRHTRADYYFGVGVEFKVFRNASHEAIAEAIRAYSAEEREAEGGVIPLLKNIRGEGEPPIGVDLMPSVNVRKKSTLQRGILRIGPRWKYDGGEMILAVICQRRWAPEDITSQRFAVVAAVEHSDPSVEVYQHIRQQTRVYQRVRVQA
jgi:hypothetical protein